MVEATQDDKAKALVLRVEGTNCDQETVNALQLAGAKADLLHINELLRKKEKLKEYQILVIPGGFSHGDYISAGIMLANQLKNLLGRQLKEFVEQDKPVIGICNGFQVLVKMGLLPALSGNMEKQEATLAFNRSGLFHDAWVHLLPQENHKCKFLSKINKPVYLPVAHAEGKFIAEDEVLDELEAEKQVVFKYVENPNGSYRDIAGICNPEGNVFGMMPHPERFLHKWMHPHWTSQDLPPEGDGLPFWRGVIEYAEKI